MIIEILSGQLSHQGQAGVLVSFGPAGNWLQVRIGLSLGSGSCFPGFTFAEPVLELIIPE